MTTHIGSRKIMRRIYIAFFGHLFVTGKSQYPILPLLHSNIPLLIYGAKHILMNRRSIRTPWEEETALQKGKLSLLTLCHFV